MSVITDIKDQLNDLMTFKHIAAAFTEAAAVKLKNIRSAFERNARFYEEINHVYHLVEINAKRLKLKQSERTISGPKRLYIAFTSNQRFFGFINTEIMRIFVDQSQKYQSEKLVIGSTGDTYLRSTGFSPQYQVIIFKDDLPNQNEIADFISRVNQFDQVKIFYPKFISFLRQEVGSIDITQKFIVEEKKLTEDEINLIFEPEIDKMIKFFDDQVRIILFKRVLLETDLARTAARLLTMSQAEERTDQLVLEKKAELRKVMRSFTNAQLLETFSGIRKWKQ